jgi:ATP synthase protein I
LCYTVPNALFALRLYLGGKKRTDGVERINPFTFFTGEFLKMLAVGGLLAAVAVWYHELHWLAFIVSFILVLKSYLLLLFVKP